MRSSSFCPGTRDRRKQGSPHRSTVPPAKPRHANSPRQECKQETPYVANNKPSVPHPSSQPLPTSSICPICPFVHPHIDITLKLSLLYLLYLAHLFHALVSNPQHLPSLSSSLFPPASLARSSLDRSFPHILTTHPGTLTSSSSIITSSLPLASPFFSFSHTPFPTYPSPNTPTHNDSHYIDTRHVRPRERHQHRQRRRAQGRHPRQRAICDGAHVVVWLGLIPPAILGTQLAHVVFWA